MFLLKTLVLVIVCSLSLLFLITTFVSATSEPVPFEVDFDITDDEDEHFDSETFESYSAFNPGEDLGEAGRTINDIIRKNLNKVLKKHDHQNFDKSTNSEMNPELSATGAGGMKAKYRAKQQSTDMLRRKRVQSNHVCPDETAPKIGDRVLLHIPSREHLMPRFTGMRVFAPPHAEYHLDRVTGAFRDSQHISDHHFGAKLLYVFDEHVIQGVWPVHDIMQLHRDLKVVVKDIHVQEDPNGKHQELCYFKVAMQ